MNHKLIAELLDRGEKGDEAVDTVLVMAGSGDVQAIEIVEAAIEHHSKEKLTYFTPGPRVSSGHDVYSSKAYERLLKSLTTKARRKTLLDDAAETQDEIIRAVNHIEWDAGSFLHRISESGGSEAVKIVQLLDTHVKVQAHLIHNGVLEPRESIWECLENKPRSENTIRWFHIVAIIFAPWLTVAWGVLKLMRRETWCGFLLILFSAIWLGAFTIMIMYLCRGHY